MKKIILSALMLTGMLTFAQDGKLTVSGTVDAYGTFSSEKNGTPGLLIADPSGAQFAGLGMANTIFSYESGKTGAVVDLAFGPRATDAATAEHVNQAYLYYNVNDKLTLTMGQFNTFLGYEVISPAANFNYTVSYLFNAGPFSHIGVKADYAVSEDFSLMVSLTNPHGEFANETPSTPWPQVGLQAGYKGQYLNILYGQDGGFGSDDSFYIDYTGGFDLSDTFYVGINAAYATSDDADAGYQGVALYLQNAFSDTFSLGLRPEFFQTTGGTEADVLALTLTANTVLTDNLSLITDLRYDSSDDLIIEGISEDSVANLTIAAVYSF